MDILITSLNTANKNGNICRNNPICLGRRNIYKYNIAGHIHCHECINQPIINDKACFFPLSDVPTTINPYAEELDDSASQTKVRLSVDTKLHSFFLIG